MRRLETKQRLIHLHGNDYPKADGLTKRDKTQDKKAEKANRYHVFPSSTNNLFPYQSMFVNYFHAVQN